MPALVRDSSFPAGQQAGKQAGAKDGESEPNLYRGVELILSWCSCGNCPQAMLNECTDNRADLQ